MSPGRSIDRCCACCVSDALSTHRHAIAQHTDGYASVYEGGAPCSIHSH